MAGGGGEFNFRNFIKIDSFELGVGLHAATPIMMADIRRLINVSKIPPATLVPPSLFPLELHKSCSNEGEIPGIVTQ